jgi:hypothetical protein
MPLSLFHGFPRRDIFDADADFHAVFERRHCHASAASDFAYAAMICRISEFLSFFATLMLMIIDAFDYADSPPPPCRHAAASDAFAIIFAALIAASMIYMLLSPFFAARTQRLLMLFAAFAAVDCYFAGRAAYADATLLLLRDILR